MCVQSSFYTKKQTRQAGALRLNEDTSQLARYKPIPFTRCQETEELEKLQPEAAVKNSGEAVHRPFFETQPLHTSAQHAADNIYLTCLNQALDPLFRPSACTDVQATVLMMSATVQPRLRSLTGFLRPCMTGPIAIAPVDCCTAL